MNSILFILFWGLLGIVIGYGLMKWWLCYRRKRGNRLLEALRSNTISFGVSYDVVTDLSYDMQLMKEHFNQLKQTGKSVPFRVNDQLMGQAKVIDVTDDGLDTLQISLKWLPVDIIGICRVCGDPMIDVTTIQTPGGYKAFRCINKRCPKVNWQILERIEECSQC